MRISLDAHGRVKENSVLCVCVCVCVCENRKKNELKFLIKLFSRINYF